MNTILRYSHPGGEFKNGLPIGNGRLAAMICGGEKNIRLALNHEWLWRGENRFRDCDDVSSHLSEVRQKLYDGDFLAGTRLANEYFAGLGGISGVKNRVDPYQPAGDFTLTVPGGDYLRSLDLETGEAVIKSGDTEIRAFASFADGFIVIGISGDAGLSLTRIDDPMCDLKTGDLSLEGQFHGGVSFSVKAKVYDGEYRTALIDIATSANGSELSVFPEKADYFEMLSRHIPAFKAAKGIAAISVEGKESSEYTDVRLENYRAGKDPTFPLLYFEYGRYLMVSGSSGELPLNLQGKWNDELAPAWESDYHLDINLEMAYWAADALGMTKQEMTLFNLCERYLPHGREAAKKLYGCRGTVFTIQTDVWGRMTPEAKGWAVWIGAAPWLASHFAKYWRYTKDDEFLRGRAYPFLKEVAAFYQDYLEKKDGTYHIAPSQSPENRFAGTGDYPVSIGIDSAMDIELAKDTLSSCVEMSEILGCDEDLRAVWKEMLEHLPPLTVDSTGRLNEFDKEREEVEPGHRHLSHLYGLYPGELFPDGDPLREACVKSLEARLSHGGGHTGWSRSWVACIMARLGRREDFEKHLTALICDFATETLLDLHPPRIFQIDGNMGGTAAICEALISCEGNSVRLLPSLPEGWRNGSFSDFRAPGALKVSCEWKDGKAVKAVFSASADGSWRIIANGNEYRLTIRRGEEKTIGF